MKPILGIIEIIVASLLVVSILLQQRGAGSSAIMGGGGSVYYARRGFEKFLFGATIGLAIAFIAISVLSLIV